MSSAARVIVPARAARPSRPALLVYEGARRADGGPVYDAQVWRRVDDVPVATWDELRDADDLFMDVRLLRAVENSMARDASMRYVLFRDQAGRPAASTCLCTYTVDGTLLAEEGLARKAACALKKISPALVKYKILFCGLPFSGGQSHLRFAPGVDTTAILTQLDAMLKKIAREDGAKSIVFKEFQEHELPAVSAIEKLGYRRADSLPMNDLHVGHKTYDEYLASLHNRKRYEIRKSLKKFTEGGLRLITTSDRAEIERLYTDQVHAMYEAVVGKADVKLELLPAEFFREMARQLPGNCEFCFALDGDRVLGFGLCLFSKAAYHPLFMGIDYERNRQHDVYFNMMYRSLADAIGHGVKDTQLGQNADEFKRSKMGSHQTPRYFYIKGVGFVMEWTIRLLFKQLFPARPLLKVAAEGGPADAST